jgi:hypothetical protein
VIDMQQQHGARPAATAAAMSVGLGADDLGALDLGALDMGLDHLGAHAGQSRLARWSTAVLRALHDSRKREGEREISRHRHLICMDDTYPDLTILRRTCHSKKSSG